MRPSLIFSVIVATHRRPSQRLEDCLEALTRQTYPGHLYEVIVVDDGSTVSSWELVEPFCGQLDLIFITQKRAGPATARNTAAAAARGEYLAFTDDDCAPAPDWLEKLAAQFADTPECVIGGHPVNALKENLYSTASQLILDCSYSCFNRVRGMATFFAGDNLALPAALFKQVGGFKTVFFLGGEDRELCSRLTERGYRMVYLPGAIVHHAHHLTFASFLRQHFHYGCGAYYYVRAMRERNSGPKTAPAAFYTNLLRYPFSQARGIKALSLLGLLMTSQLAYVAGFLWMVWRRGKNDLV